MQENMEQREILFVKILFFSLFLSDITFRDQEYELCVEDDISKTKKILLQISCTKETTNTPGANPVKDTPYP